MIHQLEEVNVKIDTPLGRVFRGFTKAVSIKTKKQVTIEFRKNWVNYLSLSEQAELTLEEGTVFRRFILKNAMARLDRNKLSILAQSVK